VTLIGMMKSETRVSYTGHLWDADIQQYYAPYRYYSPATTRWLTRDPLGMVDGPNVYGYVRGNPVGYADSRGGFRVEGNCCEKKKDIETNLNYVCHAKVRTITEPTLKNCIRRRCVTGKVKCRKCGDGHLAGYNRGIGRRFRSSTIVLCANNLNWFGHAALHEWAHSCGWMHGDGQGVPGNDGDIPTI